MPSLKNTIKNSSILGPVVQMLLIQKGYLKFKHKLAKGGKYKNLYEGKRCFIIGNGPSLKGCNLSLLNKEYTITVNSFIGTKEYDILKPLVHVMADSNRFKKENKVFDDQMYNLTKKKHKPICVFPVKFEEYLHTNGYDKQLEIAYVYTNGKVGKIKNIDFEKPLPAYLNIVNLALFSALYMGFSEIYLLGVDMTCVVKVYDENENIGYGGHFYDTAQKDEKKYVDKLHSERENELMLKEYGKVFEIFRHTRDYAEKKGVHIYNATKGGTLDVFPRVKYEDIAI